MDYRTVPPPAWETAEPSEWKREAHHARAMLRNAIHYAPALVPMFRAWSEAWEKRDHDYTVWVQRSQDHAADAVAAATQGKRAEARRSFALAVTAGEGAAAVRASSYPSYLETNPNP